MARTEPRRVELTAPGEIRVRRALISTSDKSGVLEFAQGLAELGIEILSTGGTARALGVEGVETQAVEEYTGFPEMLEGRVKTLHPRIHAGLLADRSEKGHVDALQNQEIELIDLVCVNLYPFEKVVSKPRPRESDVIESIDIGGPAMIRAAAKNHAFVAVVVSPDSYDAVLAELQENEGQISRSTRKHLAVEAFAHTARYEAAISTWFSESEDDFPAHYSRSYEKLLELAYGENSHQRAAYYAEPGARTHLTSMVSQVHGAELSFNNMLDLDAGRRIVDDFELPAAAIIKHNNPCGVGVGADPSEAFDKALATDPQSAFGGVFCFNRRVDTSLAEKLSELFVELVIAKGYEPEAVEILKQKERTRILDNLERRQVPVDEKDIKRVRGGVLIQDRDSGLEMREEMRVATKRKPTEEEWGELLFAMRVCKHVRSNAIVLARRLGTVGIGAGQMSRVDSVQLAINKAGQADGDLSGAVMASDGFFPFADGPQLAIDAGIRAIIQPGGSRRDSEVVEACDSAGVAMVFTGRRHFRH